jgi:uncharacterized protein (UPF0261 family)
MAVVLLGTLDTKGRELGHVRDILQRAGLETLVIDAGSAGAPGIEPDIDRGEVFRAAGTSAAEIAARGDRGEAVAAAARGTANLVSGLVAQGRVEGVFAAGGSAGTTIGATAMRGVPFGIPKVLVSTMASGQTRPYLGGSDILLLPSIADVAGLNRITRTVLTNAANALVGMVQGRSHEERGDARAERPIVAATMFGVTTPCVERARRVLEAAGCEVIVFHATGVGGQAMEGLVRDGQVQGVLDITTTELADELVGGVLSAGPDRLNAAAMSGVPQVVSLGALDMVNFGPRETVPERFASRKFHIHNPTVTLMRTTREENAELGRRIAVALATSRGSTAVIIPRGGVSAIDRAGQPFHDLEADIALFQAVASGLARTPRVEVVEREEHINDPTFGELCARTLLTFMREAGVRGLTPRV